MREGPVHQWTWNQNPGVRRRGCVGLQLNFGTHALTLSRTESKELGKKFSYDGWRRDADEAEKHHARQANSTEASDILNSMRRKQQLHSGDRSHPFIRKLDALTPTLSYDGWKEEARVIEWPGGDSIFLGLSMTESGVDILLARMRRKQAKCDGDRSHKDLRELDELKAALSYDGWRRDADQAEEEHARYGQASAMLDKMRRKQAKFDGDRSHKNLRELDELVARLARSMRIPSASAPVPEAPTSAVLWDADTTPIQRLIEEVLAGKSCALSCLGLQPHLTHPKETIRARFRVLAIRLHPDKESHSQATEASSSKCGPLTAGSWRPNSGCLYATKNQRCLGHPFPKALKIVLYLQCLK